jgi:hypothetical protein
VRVLEEEMRVCRYKVRSTSSRHSIFELSLLLSRGRHSCRKRDVLKKQSAGCDGSLCSMEILFWIFHRAQLWAANSIQIKILKLEKKEFKIRKKSGKD